MKKQLLTVMIMLTAMSLFAIASPALAQGGGGHWGNGPGEFIDEDGDGFNDLAPDEDGDGIPNYADEDYVRPENGQGPRPGHGMGEFVDEDGDGFNDLAPDEDGDGIPNYADEDYVRPENGQGPRPGFGDRPGNGGNGPRPGNGGPGPRPGFGTGTGDCVDSPAVLKGSFQVKAAR